MAGKVKIIQKGRSGTVQYSEGWLKKNIAEFYTEIGGGDAIAIVWVPAEKEWDAKYPWAAGRRKEIANFVAEKLRRSQAPNSKIVWDANGFSLVSK